MDEQALALSLRGAAEDDYDVDDERDEAAECTEMAVFDGHNHGAAAYMNLAVAGINTSGNDKSVNALIEKMQVDLLAFGVGCSDEVVRSIALKEIQKKIKSTYVAVTTPSTTCKQMAAKIKTGLLGIEFDEGKLLKYGTLINTHLNDLLQKGGNTDLLQTDKFLHTMKFHEVEFLDNMIKYVDLSKNIKKASMEVLESKIMLSFWTITWKTEKDKKAADKMEKAAYLVGR